MILLVPEQQSHGYERQLCDKLGASINLSAEVLSFTRLASRVETELGGAAEKVLDKGGRVLIMSLALSSVRPFLRVYSAASEKTEFITQILESCDELKSCRISPERLTELSQEAEGELADKMYDIGMICMTYDALCANIAIDPRDRLTRLAEKIGQSEFCKSMIFIDGFTDFTGQELEVIDCIMSAGADITVSLCCPKLQQSEKGVFDVELAAKRRIEEMAKKKSIQCNELYIESESSKSEQLRFVSKGIFSENPDKMQGGCDVRLLHASTLTSECEEVASYVLSLVREGYRYRDIAVASRGFESIAPIAESIFKYYDVPVFLNRMEDILEKPVICLLLSALECAFGVWEPDELLRYLKSGLVGLNLDECDELESYIFTWSLRGDALVSANDWMQNPNGYKGAMTDEEKEELAHINSIRRRAVLPILHLRENGKKAVNALQQAQALYTFMEDIALADVLVERANRFALCGELQRAEEYRQLWDIIIGALEQTAVILGEREMHQREFAGLLRIVLAQYDVGSIPASIDCVQLGDISRLSGSGVKCLILMDSDSGKLPAVSEAKGLFSDFERIELEGVGVQLLESPELRLSRELGNIFKAISLPDEKLMLSYHGGKEVSPSFVLSKISEILSLEFEQESEARRTAAIKPCFALACSVSKSCQASAAREVLFGLDEQRESLKAVEIAANAVRGKLSENVAAALYGSDILLSASRAEKFIRCHFEYFMRYGLRAKPRGKAEIDAPQTGLFVHYVLEKTTAQLKPLGGIGAVDEKTLESTAKANMQLYLDETFGGMEDKNGRFRYLFSRLSQSTMRILKDMAGELSVSSFEPMSFELDFNDERQENNSGGFTVTGSVDRADGYVKDGKLYLRVVDYKTGKKSFDISDIWYGLGMQTLLYLFELQKHGSEIYGKEIVPAGVLYAPARDIILNAGRDVSDEQISEAMAKELVRSGLLLDNSEIISAMEDGENPRYLPVKIKNGEYSGKALATLERFGQLSKHVDKVLSQISEDIKNGRIEAQPYYETRDKGECDFCDFRAACLFNEDFENDKKRFLPHLSDKDAWQKFGEEAND